MQISGYRKSIIILLVTALHSHCLIVGGQETIFIEGAKGVGVIAGRISESDARRDAINQAKIEALRQAGVTEHLSSYELLFTSESDHDYSEFFSSDVQSELQGAVQYYEVVDEQRKLNPYSNFFEYEVTIDATVIKYTTRPDPAFITKVDGIKGVYDRGETLSFSVHSTKDCYLSIFNITDNNAYLMYPNQWEVHQGIAAGETKEFPFGFVEYYLDNSSSEPEVNRLIFVFTKEPVHFLRYRDEDQSTDSEIIFSWIYSITPDIRRVDYHTFVIR
ncbi:MAG: DUF4384 domain-containing protein [Marinilabiliales bacterium]|nr:MAG: DUF4384 domain-containing protein [Marinilabiliales bacterium]